MGRPPIYTPPGRSPREALLVGASLIVALALGWAGWLVGSAPDELAQSEVASTARVVARDLESQWRALRSSDGFRAFSNGWVESIHARAEATPLSALERNPILRDDPEDPRAFTALFREAERLARRGSVAEARELLGEALATPTMESDAPALLTLELRLALAEDDDAAPERVLEVWDRIVREVHWSATRDDRPIRLVAGWIAAGQLGEERERALRVTVVTEGASYIIGEASPLDRLLRTSAGLRLEVDPETAATLEICDSVWPGSAAELRATSAWAKRAAAALARALVTIDGVQPAATWSLSDTSLGQSAFRGGEDVFLIEEAEFPDRLRQQLPLPSGFSLALDTEAALEGDG